MKNIDKYIENYIYDLSICDTSEDVFNQYSLNYKTNEIRRNNLFIYLKKLYNDGAKTMLVGEAPGYKGARYTGIPFTSEYILLNHCYFGEKNGYRKTNELDKIEKENTAKIVWGTLGSINITPILWNAYPFHPFKIGNSQSNRAPRKDELKVGGRFLTNLIDILEIKNIIAVGKNAYKILQEIEIETEYIRHPSYGGKKEFMEGIKTISREVCEM